MVSIIKILLLLSLTFFAVISDSRSLKIRNSLTMCYMITGIFINAYFAGVSGILISLFGIVVPFILFFILFYIKVIGAGDIKLYMAIGSIIGYPNILNVIVYSIVAGGIICIFYLYIHKNFKQRIDHFSTYIFNMFLLKKLIKYENGEKYTRDKIKFSYAIFAGTLIYLVVASLYQN